MYKGVDNDIKKIPLDTSLFNLHKKGIEKSDFGMDGTPELLDGGFGLYSSVDLIGRIGPVKTEYFRIGLNRKGSATFEIGLETYITRKNSIVFGFPGQIFSLDHLSEDFFTFYMLFSESFISRFLALSNIRSQYPFFNYSGIQCFELSDETANEIEQIIYKINAEIKTRKSGISDIIALYIQLIIVHANRHYGEILLSKQTTNSSSEILYNSFVKLVSQHFIKIRKVSEYAKLLFVSPDHLNRAIKANSTLTAHELINEMILIEAKAYLLHSKMSIAEIAYKLEFTDPSHFNKFFKNLSGISPLQFRNKSD